MVIPNTFPRPVPAIALLAVSLWGLSGIGGCSRESETSSPHPKEVRCRTERAESTMIPLHLTASGSIQPSSSVMVSTRMMGWVRKVLVTEGDLVRKGDRLIAIDDTDLRAKMAQAQAGITEARAVLANAEKMAARFENLFAEKSVSRQQLEDVLTGRDRAAAGVEMAEAGMDEVKVHLGYLNITAPIDGLVGRKMIEEGDMANPGMPLLILEEAGAMKVVAHIGEKDVGRLTVGDPVIIELSSPPGSRFTSTLSKIIPTANPGSRTYDIEVPVPPEAGHLKGGMFARVMIPAGERQAITVPSEAVVRRGQLTGVWTVGPDHSTHLRWIRLGREVGGSHEVLSGLAGGESVVVSHDTPLVEGDRVVE